MKKIPILIFVIIAIFGFMQYSCDFEPTGVNFVKIDSTSNPGTLITEGTLEQDTIYLSSQISSGLKVNWKFTLNQKIFKVEFFQDGKKLSLYPNYGEKVTDSGYVYVSFDENNIKYSDLKCKIYYASGTGSMVDLYKKETAIIEKIWHLVIFPTKLNLSQITSCIKENLNVVVTYTKYSGPYFNGYYLIKNELDTVAFTLDQSQLSLIDTTYIGETSEYKIATKLKSSFYSSDTVKVNFDIIPEYLVTYQNDTYQFKIKLLKHKYSDRLDTAFFSLVNDYNIIERGKINLRLEDTYYFLKAKTGNSFNFYCKSRYSKSPNSILYNQSEVMGNPIEQCDQFKMCANGNIYARIYGNNQLKCFSMNDSKFIKTVYNQSVQNYEFSPNGDYLIVVDNSKNKVLLYETKNNLQIDIINTGPIISESIAISNNKILVYWTGERIDNKYKFFLYDVNNKKVIYEILCDPQIMKIIFSDDNKYLSAGRTIYDLSGSKPEVIGSINSGYIYSFDPENEDNVYVAENNTLTLKNYKTNSLIRNICFVDLLVSIDSKNRTVAYQEYNNSLGLWEMLVKDMKTWGLKFKINSSDSFSPSAFYNNTLFSRNYYLPFE